MTKPICLIIGAGAGIGGNIAKKFAKENYHAFLCRRSNPEGLQTLIDEINSAGGTASGKCINIIQEGTIEQLVEEVENEIGPIDTAVYNLGAQMGNKSLKDTSHKSFEMGWRLGTFGLFRLASSLFPYMQNRGKGNLLVTSATASMRGNAGQHAHSAGMAGRRMLCQSLNHEFAPLGIHIAHIIVDGMVDAPDTLGRMVGAERFEALKESMGDGMMDPERIAETYFHIAKQHRSVWTHEMDLRPYTDVPWWNTKL